MLIWNQEAAILDVTELACKLMASHHISRTELAHRLKKTKGYVSQLLDGSRNMTIRTISDVFTVLGYKLRIDCEPLSKSDSNKIVYESISEAGGLNWVSAATATNTEFASMICSVDYGMNGVSAAQIGAL